MITLTDEERLRFSLYLKQEAKTSQDLSAQLAKISSPSGMKQQLDKDVVTYLWLAHRIMPDCEPEVIARQLWPPLKNT